MKFMKILKKAGGVLLVIIGIFFFVSALKMIFVDNPKTKAALKDAVYVDAADTIDPENDGNRGRADLKRRERGEDHRRQLLPQDLRTEPDSRKSAAWQYTDSGWKMYFQCGFPERNGVLRCRYERSGWHYRSAPDY